MADKDRAKNRPSSATATSCQSHTDPYTIVRHLEYDNWDCSSKAQHHLIPIQAYLTELYSKTVYEVHVRKGTPVKFITDI